MMSQVSEDFPDFSNDWATIEAFVAVLAPLYGATLEIEKRSTSIANYIPFSKQILKLFNTPTETGIYDFKMFKKAIYDGLSSRLKGWEDKK